MSANHQARDLAVNLAPNVPFHAAVHTFDGTPAAQRLEIPLQFREFTEAFLIAVVNPPTLDAVPAVALQFLLQVDAQRDAAAAMIAAGEIVMPGCSYRQVIPGWVDKVRLDGAGFAVLSGEVAEVTARVIVYRMDRCQMQRWQGPR